MSETTLKWGMVEGVRIGTAPGHDPSAASKDTFAWIVDGASRSVSSCVVQVGSPDMSNVGTNVTSNAVVSDAFVVAASETYTPTRWTIGHVLRGAGHSLVLNSAVGAYDTATSIARGWSEDISAVGGDFQRAFAGALNVKRRRSAR
jgi:hypothetical protein